MHNQSSNLFIPASILIGSLIIAGAIMAGSPANTRTISGFVIPPVGDVPSPIQKQPSPVPAQTIDAAKVSSAGNPYLGNPKAPVTIAYWYDYQCPFCQKNEQAVMNSLINEYVNTGKVRIVFKDLQFLGRDSQTLGVTARAVWDVAPSKYYLWHKGVIDNQGQENSGWATADKIMSISTVVLGDIEAERVVKLATTNATIYQKALDADKTEGSALGIDSTPTMVIGKTVLIGAQSYSQVKTAIDAALAGK